MHLSDDNVQAAADKRESIYISYVSVCLSVTASPAATIGPRTLIFCMDIGLDDRLLIFCGWQSANKDISMGEASTVRELLEIHLYFLRF